MNAHEPAQSSTPLPPDSRSAGQKISEKPPLSIPDYELLRRIGGGSYGEVWLARSATGVLRALKIVHRSTFEDDRPFQREFEGIQRFERISREHPGQLALFHIGRNEAAGYFYYVMELADPVTPDAGCSILDSRSADATREVPHPVSSIQHPESYAPHTLRADLEQGRLPAASVLEIGLTLTEALAHLHSHSLVHRDVKPSNVIFVNGRPKLADIGLVTDASDQCSMVGTEGYLPPDGPGTPQADIFALGKVLYEALTGLDRRKFPELPEEFHAWPDAKLAFELNEVILKACEADRGRHYANTDAIGADLELLQRGKSIKEIHARERIWFEVKRAATVLGILAGVIALIAFLWHPQPVDYEGKPSLIAEANELFRRGLYSYQKRTATGVREAIVHFEDAVRIDPEFAKAYAWLAASQCWFCAGTNRAWELVPVAANTARRALLLDPRLAKAHLALGWYALEEKWDWAEAEHHFTQALKYAPHDPEIYEWRGFARGSWAGRFDEGISDLNRALELRPDNDSISARHFLAFVCAAGRRYDKAISLGRTVTEMEPSGTLLAYSQLADSLVNAGRFEEGIEMGRRADVREKGISETKADEHARELLAALKKGGEQGYWQQLLDWAEASGGDPYPFAALHARLGHTSEALAWLEKAEKQHDLGLFQQIKTDPALDSLRDQPRFQALLRRLKLDH